MLFNVIYYYLSPTSLIKNFINQLFHTHMKISSLIRIVVSVQFVLISYITLAQVHIVIKPGPEDGKDAYVNSYYERMLGDTPSFIAAAWTYTGIEGIGRSYIQFDLPELPAEMHNFKATLNFYYNYSSSHVGHGGDNSVKLERIIENWSENDIMWYYQPAVTSQNAVILPASTSENQDYPNIDVTQLICDMYAYPESSFGIRMSLLDESIYRSMIFASSDHEDEDIRPSLIISYDTCEMPSDHFNYEVQGLFCHFSYEDSPTTSWNWNFGNGYGSTLLNPSYFFNDPGTFDVCLTVVNNCDTLTFCQSVTICEELVPAFSFTIEDMNVNFTNQTIDGLEYFWDFGNGFYSYLENPEFQFEYPGEYLVCLSVTDLCGTAMICDTVIILEEDENQTGELGTDFFDSNSPTINVYPNPASEFVIIKSTSVLISRIDIYNSMGVFVKSYNVDGASNNYRLSLQSINSGFYFLRISTDTSVITKRLVIS